MNARKKNENKKKNTQRRGVHHLFLVKHFPLLQKKISTVKKNFASDTFPCDFSPKICLFFHQ